MTEQEAHPVDHTPVTMVQEIQQALVSAGIDIRLVAVNIHRDAYPSASILLAAPGAYTSPESDRLGHYLLVEPRYREQGDPGERIGILEGTTRSGFRVSIHCAPRMTAEEVAAEIAQEEK